MSLMITQLNAHTRRLEGMIPHIQGSALHKYTNVVFVRIPVRQAWVTSDPTWIARGWSVVLMVLGQQDLDDPSALNEK